MSTIDLDGDMEAQVSNIHDDERRELREARERIEELEATHAKTERWLKHLFNDLDNQETETLAAAAAFAERMEDRYDELCSVSNPLCWVCGHDRTYHCRCQRRGGGE